MPSEHLLTNNTDIFLEVGRAKRNPKDKHYVKKIGREVSHARKTDQQLRVLVPEEEGKFISLHNSLYTIFIKKVKNRLYIQEVYDYAYT